MAEWFAVDTDDAVTRLVSAWDDAPTANLELCAMLLDVARDQVIDYAPDPADLDETEATALSALLEVRAVLEIHEATPGTVEQILADITAASTTAPVRSNYVYAQLQQAKTLWNAGRVTSNGEVGMDGFTFTPRPLDKTIRGIIRPTKGRFSVG